MSTLCSGKAVKRMQGDVAILTPYPSPKGRGHSVLSPLGRDRERDCYVDAACVKTYAARAQKWHFLPYIVIERLRLAIPYNIELQPALSLEGDEGL